MNWLGMGFIVDILWIRLWTLDWVWICSWLINRVSCTEDSHRFCRLVWTHLRDVVLVKYVSSLKCAAWLLSVVSSLFVGSFFVSSLGSGANWPINLNGFLSVSWSLGLISFIGLWKFRTLYMIISQRWIFTSFFWCVTPCSLFYRRFLRRFRSVWYRSV